MYAVVDSATEDGLTNAARFHLIRLPSQPLCNPHQLHDSKGGRFHKLFVLRMSKCHHFATMRAG
jgi:hypothetical protein